MSTMKQGERRECWLFSWLSVRALTSLTIAVAVVGGSPCWAQARPTGLDPAALQHEADYRVVAARCGTPAFEKQFFVQSRNFVAASNAHDREATARQESAIRSLRRNPIALIGSQADCKGQGEELRRVMAERVRGRGAQRGK